MNMSPYVDVCPDRYIFVQRIAVHVVSKPTPEKKIKPKLSDL
jgi:hypothetical protein